MSFEEHVCLIGPIQYLYKTLYLVNVLVHLKACGDFVWKVSTWYLMRMIKDYISRQY